MIGRTKAKAGTVLCAVSVIAYLTFLPWFFLAIGVPGIIVAVISVLYLVVIIALAWYTIQRMQEIEEGLEDAVDNY